MSTLKGMLSSTSVSMLTRTLPRVPFLSAENDAEPMPAALLRGDHADELASRVQRDPVAFGQGRDRRRAAPFASEMESLGSRSGPSQKNIR